MAQYTKEQLLLNGTNELRSLARSQVKRGELEGVSGVDIVHARKEQLIEWMLAGKKVLNTSGLVEEKEGKNENEGQSASSKEQAAEQAAEQAQAQAAPAAPEAAAAEPEANAETANAETASTTTDPLAKAIADAIKPHMKQLEENMSGGKIKIDIPQMPEVTLDRQHYMFEMLLKVANAGINPMLVGPAGTGKTHASMSLAEALGRTFDAMSFSPMTTEAKIIGYKDVKGTYHETAMVRQYRDGGVMLGDEMDAGNAAGLTQLNMMLANERAGTPEGVISRHKDFIFVACANTYGTGANRQYVGRNQLDSATLDRFAFIDWDYDEALEGVFAGVKKESKKLDIEAGGIPSAAQWFERSIAVRHAVEKLELRHVIGRAVRHGVTLASAGIGLDHLDKMLLFRGLPLDQVEMIKTEAKI